MERLALRGVRVWGRHGANPGERDRAQPFVVDVWLDADVAGAMRSDALSDTVDYAALHERVVAIVSGTSYALLERLAADLLDAALEHPRVKRASVRIAKPELLRGATPSVTATRERHAAAIGIGSNVGDSVAAVEAAIAALARVGSLRARSSLYRTAPWGKTDQPEFVNAVAAIDTTLEPRALLNELKAIERDHGRVPGERWGPRAIDLDLLAYDDLRLDEPGLQVPHPHLRERAFVLIPLAEIDPRYTPLLAKLDPTERAGIRKL